MATLTLNEAEESVEQARSDFQATAGTIERRVLGNVDHLASMARETTESIKGFVHGASDQIMGVLDMTRHVNENPLGSVATAMATGFAVGMMTKNSDSSAISQLWSTLQRELVSIGELAIVQMTSKCKDGVQAFAQDLGKPGHDTNSNPPPPYRS